MKTGLTKNQELELQELLSKPTPTRKQQERIDFLIEKKGKETPPAEAPAATNEAELAWGVDFEGLSVINNSEMYNFEGNGKHQKLKDGKVYEVTAEFLKIYIRNGYGKLVD